MIGKDEIEFRKAILNELKEIKMLITDFLKQYHHYEGKK